MGSSDAGESWNSGSQYRFLLGRIDRPSYRVATAAAEYDKEPNFRVEMSLIRDRRGAFERHRIRLPRESAAPFKLTTNDPTRSVPPCALKSTHLDTPSPTQRILSCNDRSLIARSCSSISTVIIQTAFHQVGEENRSTPTLESSRPSRGCQDFVIKKDGAAKTTESSGDTAKLLAGMKCTNAENSANFRLHRRAVFECSALDKTWLRRKNLSPGIFATWRDCHFA